LHSYAADRESAGQAIRIPGASWRKRESILMIIGV
jgi:hypothetical protein